MGTNLLDQCTVWRKDARRLRMKTTMLDVMHGICSALVPIIVPYAQTTEKASLSRESALLSTHLEEEVYREVHAFYGRVGDYNLGTDREAYQLLASRYDKILKENKQSNFFGKPPSGNND